MEKITVVKIGGNVIDDPAALRGFLADFASLPGAKILVHGGGKLATRLAQKLELQVQMVDGRRITDKGTLDIVTMVYAGLVNKQLVAGLQAAGCNALGLSAPTATPSWRAAAHPNRSTTASWATSKVSTTRCSGNFSGQASRPYSVPSCTTGRARCSTATPTAWLRPWHSAPPDRPHGAGLLLRKKRRAARPGRRDDAHPRNHGRVVRRAQSRRHRQQRDDPQGRERTESRCQRRAERHDQTLGEPAERHRNGNQVIRPFPCGRTATGERTASSQTTWMQKPRKPSTCSGR